MDNNRLNEGMKEVRPHDRKTIDMNRIIHFEIHAGNPERAVKFYRDVFGWEINEWVMPGVQMKEEDRYWLVTTGSKTESGINGGIVSRRVRPPSTVRGPTHLSVRSALPTLMTPLTK